MQQDVVTVIGNSQPECFWPMFTRIGEECVFVGFNQNVWVELIIGVLLGGIVVTWFVSLVQGWRLRQQWRKLRGTRSDLILNEIDDLVASFGLVLKAVGRPEVTQLGYRKDLFQEETEIVLTKLGYLRLWFVSSQTIFPTKLLNCLSEIERGFIVVDNRLTNFVSYADVVATRIEQDACDEEMFFQFVEAAAECIALLDAFATLAKANLGDLASEWMVNALDANLNRLKDDGKNDLVQVAVAAGLIDESQMEAARAEEASAPPAEQQDFTARLVTSHRRARRVAQAAFKSGVQKLPLVVRDRRDTLMRRRGQ